MTKLSFIILAMLGLCTVSLRAEETVETTAAKPALKYKGQQELNFEQLIIDGQLRRPDLSVVTGSSGNGSFGLLRVRGDFKDQLSIEAGEEAK